MSLFSIIQSSLQRPGHKYQHDGLHDERDVLHGLLKPAHTAIVDEMLHLVGAVVRQRSDLERHEVVFLATFHEPRCVASVRPYKAIVVVSEILHADMAQAGRVVPSESFLRIVRERKPFALHAGLHIAEMVVLVLVHTFLLSG